MKETSKTPAYAKKIVGFINESGRSRKDFELLVGSRGHASEILSGKRRLSFSVLKRLVCDWDMDANDLLRDDAKNSSVNLKTKTTQKKSIVWELD